MLPFILVIYFISMYQLVQLWLLLVITVFFAKRYYFSQNHSILTNRKWRNGVTYNYTHTSLFYGWLYKWRLLGHVHPHVPIGIKKKKLASDYNYNYVGDTSKVEVWLMQFCRVHFEFLLIIIIIDYFSTV